MATIAQLEAELTSIFGNNHWHKVGNVTTEHATAIGTLPITAYQYSVYPTLNDVTRESTFVMFVWFEGNVGGTEDANWLNAKPKQLSTPAETFHNRAVTYLNNRVSNNNLTDWDTQSLKVNFDLGKARVKVLPNPPLAWEWRLYTDGTPPTYVDIPAPE